jgi:hypothetical protein
MLTHPLRRRERQSVQGSTHHLGDLPIRKALCELHQGDQSQSARCDGGTSPYFEEF